MKGRAMALLEVFMSNPSKHTAGLIHSSSLLVKSDPHLEDGKGGEEANRGGGCDALH